MPATDFLETVAGMVRDQNCAASTRLGNPIGHLTVPVFETLRPPGAVEERVPQLEAAIEAESNPFNQQKLKTAITEVNE